MTDTAQILSSLRENVPCGHAIGEPQLAPGIGYTCRDGFLCDSCAVRETIAAKIEELEARVVELQPAVTVIKDGAMGATTDMVRMTSLDITDKLRVSCPREPRKGEAMCGDTRLPKSVRFCPTCEMHREAAMNIDILRALVERQAQEIEGGDEAA